MARSIRALLQFRAWRDVSNMLEENKAHPGRTSVRETPMGRVSYSFYHGWLLDGHKEIDEKTAESYILAGLLKKEGLEW